MRRALTYAAFIVLTLGGGLLIGLISRPDGWYAALAKPAFNPPSWVFGPVWSLLYVLIGIAGARTFLRSREGTQDRSMALWSAQLVLNFAWTPIFFGMHRPGGALVVIVLLLVTIVAFIARQWRTDTIAAVLFVPYAAWVAFATALNAAIVMLN